MPTKRLLAIPIALALLAAAPATAPAACDSESLVPTSSNVSKISKATRCLLNAERKKRDRPALKSNDDLAQAAKAHAKDMLKRDYFDHESPEGETPADRIEKAGYEFADLGENIASGSGRRATPKAIVRLWMDSKGHRANILSRDYTEFGVGVAANSQEAMFVNTFGRPD